MTKSKLFFAALVVMLVGSVASSEAADTLDVHLVSQTTNNITLGWTPQAGYGYLFFQNCATIDTGCTLVSRTNDPSRSQVTFQKGHNIYKVSVITEGNRGTYTTITPPPPTAKITQTIVNGSTISGVVTWHGVYDANNDGVEDDPGSVRFYVDNNLVLTEIDPPFGDTTGFWQSTTVANASHTFRVDAINSASQVVATNTVTATVANNVTPPPLAACSDTIDNDGDGLIDYPNDPGCTSTSDTDENNVTPPPSGNVFITPTGNDGNACTSALPCRTWTRGYQAAGSGDTISVAAGSYPGWDMTGSKAVTFRVTGGTATLTGRINLQTLQNATFWGPINITIPAENDLSMKLSGCTQNIEFHGLTGHTFDISDSSTNIRVFGGDWGNYTQRSFSSDSVVSGGAGFPGWSGCGDGIVRNVVFDGVRFHDVQFVDSSQWGGGHPDCVESSGSTDGVTFRNGQFDHCGNTFIGWYTDWGSNYNLLVENNLMYKTTADTYYGVQIGNKPGYSCGGMVFRYNTYDPDEPNAAYPYAPPLMGCTNDPSGFQVYGNIFRAGSPGGDCGNATFSYNVWEQAPSCGANSVVGTAGYVARGSDYHLAAGAFAIGKGDPSRFPGTDFEGTLRTAPPDAGMDQR